MQHLSQGFEITWNELKSPFRWIPEVWAVWAQEMSSWGRLMSSCHGIVQSRRCCHASETRLKESQGTTWWKASEALNFSVMTLWCNIHIAKKWSKSWMWDESVEGSAPRQIRELGLKGRWAEALHLLKLLTAWPGDIFVGGLVLFGSGASICHEVWKGWGSHLQCHHVDMRQESAVAASTWTFWGWADNGCQLRERQVVIPPSFGDFGVVFELFPRISWWFGYSLLKGLPLVPSIIQPGDASAVLAQRLGVL